MISETTESPSVLDSQARKAPLYIPAGSDEPSWVVSARSGDASRAARTKADAPPAPKSAPKTTPKPAPRKRPKRKKPRKKPGRVRLRLGRAVGLFLVAALLIGLLVGGAIGGSRLMDIKRTLDAGENTFYPNLSMNGIPLAGMTLDQAAQVVSQQVAQQIGGFSIVLHTQDGQSWTIGASDLRMTYDIANQLDQLWAIGHTGNARERYEQVKALEENPKNLSTTLTYDLSTVNTILTRIKQEVDLPAINAIRLDDPTVWPPFRYVDDVPGQTLDITGLNEHITKMVESLSSGTVELTPTAVPAAVTRAQLEGEIVQLASYETAIGNTSHEGRFTNIEVGTKKFNHLIVAAGESVSFNSVTGKRTEANGYVQAPEIAYGEYVMGIGGGICQVSSTLYNCVVNAGLQVTKRVQHSLASNYVPMGLDATVSDNRLDFVFKNNTGAPLYFETQYYKKKGYWYSRFTIYGRPNPVNYSYHLESQVRETIPLPEPTMTPDEDMAHVIYKDETELISKGEEGYVVDVYLVTTNSNGLEVARVLQYTDTYKPLAPRYWVGIMDREIIEEGTGI